VYEQRRVLETFRDWSGDIGLRTITRLYATTFIDDVLTSAPGKGGRGKASGATVQKKLSALISYWDFLVERGHAPENNPWKGRSVPKSRSKKRAYTWDELRTLFRSPNLTGVARDAAILALFLGARLEDITCLHSSDIQGNHIHIKGGKTDNNPRWVPLCGPALRVVQERAKAGGYILHELKEGPWGKRSGALSKKIGRIRDKVFGKGSGAEIDTHSFRRSYATAGEQVADVVLLSRLMGHSAPTLATSIYSAGAFKERLEEAQERITKILIEKTGTDLW
jgi:integrase